MKIELSLRQLAFGLSGLGAVILLFAALIDTAPEGTHNIGLMQGQMMVFFSGCLLSLIGAILFAATVTADSKPTI